MTVPGGIPGGSSGPAIAGSMPALSVREVRGAIGDIWIEPRSLPYGARLGHPNLPCCSVGMVCQVLGSSVGEGYPSLCRMRSAITVPDAYGCPKGERGYLRMPFDGFHSPGWYKLKLSKSQEVQPLSLVLVFCV